ncbi:TRAP transporter small permease [Glutamicibacter sp.]|uniref:TRAP transporter small permease n=1 Tax=Glutamicibacter sp. TaxID=1931995 RepID=UPI002B46B67D|nr:TRAP transporter small permease [Glutamicibacter sp.]HJX79312.1 TRAP transporter small permease [Glutamicibacter sp.]
MFTLEKSLVAGEKLVVTLLMIMAFAVIAFMVPVRYFNWQIPDLSEVAMYSIASLTFLCIGLLVRTGGHISIEVAALAKSQRLRFILRQIANVGILLFVVLFGIQAFKLLSAAMTGAWVSSEMSIPLSVPFGAMVIGLLFATFHTLMNLVRDLRVLRTPGAEFEMENDEVIPE